MSDKSKVPMFTFVKAAIQKLRTVSKDGKQYKGIHAVFSGFNGAFRSYYGIDQEQAKLALDSLVKEGKIVITPARGGVMIYLSEDAPRKSEYAVLGDILSGIDLESELENMEATQTSEITKSE